MSPASAIDASVPVVRVRNLAKRWGDVCALDGVSLDVARGEVIADIAVFRSSVGNWYALQSTTNSLLTTTFGAATDKPTPTAFTP